MHFRRIFLVHFLIIHIYNRLFNKKVYLLKLTIEGDAYKRCSMKFLTWNVSKKRPHPDTPYEMADALAALNPDVIVLTEYPLGPSHKPFLERLTSHGFTSMKISEGNGHIPHTMIVSKLAFKPTGNQEPKTLPPPLASSVLGVHLANPDIEILGLSVPVPLETATLRSCHEWIAKTASSAVKCPSVILGDFNLDPRDSARDQGMDLLRRLMYQGWTHALPPRGVSWWPERGSSGRSLDHAFLSPHFDVHAMEYITQSRPYVFTHGERAMSDHAVLLVDAEMKQSC